jgi:hypothetical protein
MRLPPITATRRTEGAIADAADFFAGAFLAGAFLAADFLAGAVSAMAVSSIFVNDGDERDEHRIRCGGLAPIHEVTVSEAFQIPMVSER